MFVGDGWDSCSVTLFITWDEFLFTAHNILSSFVWFGMKNGVRLTESYVRATMLGWLNARIRGPVYGFGVK